MIHVFEPYGGDSAVLELLQQYVKNATAEMKDFEITSCMAASL